MPAALVRNPSASSEIITSRFGCAGGGIRFDDAVEHVLSLAQSRFTETVPSSTRSRCHCAPSKRALIFRLRQVRDGWLGRELAD